jgi:endonuclease/exonuclease/phosphatase (EEP) superfamily protein YafD
VRRLERAGLVDAWQVAGRGDGLTVPAYAPRRRIDFVFSDASFRPVSADVVLSSVSDHRGVRAELDLLATTC